MKYVKPELPSENREHGNGQDHPGGEETSGLDGGRKYPVLALLPSEESQ